MLFDKRFSRVGRFSLVVLVLLGALRCTKVSGNAEVPAGYSYYEGPARSTNLTGRASGAFYVSSGRKEDFSCSGTLIAPDIVLTAAHCFSYYRDTAHVQPNPLILFRLTDEKSRQRPSVIAVSSYVIHPGYKGESGPNVYLDEDGLHSTHSEMTAAMLRCDFMGLDNPDIRQIWLKGEASEGMLLQEEAWMECLDKELSDVTFEETHQSNDIALVFLQERFLDADLAALPGSGLNDIMEGSELVVAGYGNRYEHPSLPVSFGILHESNISVLQTEGTEFTFSGSGTVACPGDSGGGIFLPNLEALEIVGLAVRTGVTILSRRCLGSSAATAVGPHLPWIEETIRESRESNRWFGKEYGLLDSTF